MYRQNERTIPPSEALEILHEALRQTNVDSTCGKCGAPARTLPTGDGLPRIECDNGHQHGSNFVNIPMDQVRDLVWVTKKFAKENAFDIDNLVDIEQRLMATLRYPNPEGGYVERTLSGALDALFVIGEAADHAIVLDWKDTWGLPAPTDLGFDGYFQQRMYAWLVMRNYPTVQRVTTRELYVRFGAGDDLDRPKNCREADIYRDELDDVDRELSALAERFDRSFEQSVFPPSPGRHCAMCPLPERCPIFPGVRIEGRIQNEADALRFAKEASVARAALDGRLKEMKAWTSVRGPVPVSDHKGPRQWGFRESSRRSTPKKEVMEAALRQAEVEGVSPNLDSLYKDAKVTRFEEHTPKRPDPEVSPEEESAALTAALEASVSGP
jgi:hypothetical protein